MPKSGSLVEDSWGVGGTNQEPQREQLASENPQLLALMYPNVHSKSGWSPVCSSSGCEDAKDLGSQQVCRERRKHAEFLSQLQPMGGPIRQRTFYEVPTPRTRKGVTVQSDLCLPPQALKAALSWGCSDMEVPLCRHATQSTDWGSLVGEAEDSQFRRL